MTTAKYYVNIFRNQRRRSLDASSPSPIVSSLASLKWRNMLDIIFTSVFHSLHHLPHGASALPAPAFCPKPFICANQAMRKSCRRLAPGLSQCKDADWEDFIKRKRYVRGFFCPPPSAQQTLPTPRVPTRSTLFNRRCKSRVDRIHTASLWTSNALYSSGN